MYYGAVEARDGQLALTGSRAIGVVGIGRSVAEAERIAEKAANAVKGDVYHRKDIGTASLIARRKRHIEHLTRKTDASCELTRAVG